MKTKDYILSLAQAHGGFLTVDDVLQDARNASSPIHKNFEWNDTIAAEKYRRDQARTLIESVKIRIDAPTPVTINALVSVPSDRRAGGGYRLATDVLKGPEQIRNELFKEMRDKTKHWAQQAAVFAPDKLGAIKSFEEQLQ